MALLSSSEQGSRNDAIPPGWILGVLIDKPYSQMKPGLLGEQIETIPT
jgi:hypothetical protein